MAQTRIVVDGDVLLNKDIGEWTSAVPELSEYLKPGAKPQPHMQAVLVVMAQATLRGQPFSAEVQTRPGGWNLDVTEG